MIIILYFIISFSFIFAEQKFLGWISNNLYRSIVQTGDELLKLHPDNKSISQEVENLKIFENQRVKLSFITKIISVTEFIVFATLVIILFVHYKNNYYQVFFDVSKFLGVWLAIKTLGSYGQWSAVIFGRASFYTFLLCTLINVFFAVILGLAWFALSLN